jgi:hypothetical protein
MTRATISRWCQDRRGDSGPDISRASELPGGGLCQAGTEFRVAGQPCITCCASMSPTRAASLLEMDNSSTSGRRHEALAWGEGRG